MEKHVNKLKQLNKDLKSPCGQCDIRSHCNVPGRCPAYTHWRKVYLSRKITHD